ncbi:hypothetical protein L7F22_038347 [Adiantum nelumboides]|nr:hypothetical protein [Adiantum nelumboides]
MSTHAMASVEDNMEQTQVDTMEFSQMDSQLSKFQFSPNMVPNSQTLPQSFLPFVNNFTSLMHGALFRPPPTTFVAFVTSPSDVAQHPTSTSPIAPIGALRAQATSPVAAVSTPNPRVSKDRVPSSQSNSTSPPTTRPTTCKRKGSNIWPTSEVNVLLDLYEDK